MSYIILPDPHPGRCKNHRPGNAGNQAKRCLDYEGVPHQCTFPPDPQPVEFNGWSGSTSVYAPAKPTPWVKPGRAASERNNP